VQGYKLKQNFGMILDPFAFDTLISKRNIMPEV